MCEGFKLARGRGGRGGGGGGDTEANLLYQNGVRGIKCETKDEVRDPT